MSMPNMWQSFFFNNEFHVTKFKGGKHKSSSFWIGIWHDFADESVQSQNIVGERLGVFFALTDLNLK